MAERLGKWRVTFHLDEVCELKLATVDVEDEGGHREVVRMITGPFDSPDEVLDTIIQLIDHAEWHGEQLRMALPTHK